MSGQNNIGNLLRDVIGRLQRLEEDSESGPSASRAEVPTRTPSNSMLSARGRHYQDTLGPSCSTSRRRFYPYNTSIERNRLFRPSRHCQNNQPKNKKIEKWRHEFVCLANKRQTRVPSPMEKVELVHANLGPLYLELTLSSDAQMFHEELLKSYPKLESCGGYELLRGSDANNKDLIVIPPPVGGYTALFLKSVVSHAKIYIRPLQEDLSLSPTNRENTVVYSFCRDKVMSFFI